jgi:hypothetical protein
MPRTGVFAPRHPTFLFNISFEYARMSDKFQSR